MNDVYCGLLSQVDKSWLRDLFIAHCGIGIIFVTIRTWYAKHKNKPNLPL